MLNNIYRLGIMSKKSKISTRRFNKSWQTAKLNMKANIISSRANYLDRFDLIASATAVWVESCRVAAIPATIFSSKVGAGIDKRRSRRYANSGSRRQILVNTAYSNKIKSIELKNG